ncbi:helix-turn-helix domain-containing protein [Aquisalimonas asiatica]|uniref:Predicted DNA-binding protein, contains XRE-type HTH domain n=1 Tax=Aquisalimonas asiatica TaxID=406100 RepID=A0A1H8SMU8_9GAMM|nr:XRE family transcriptional regulator [Aquisalimonas asiatica]SEO80289.1 Predicted DNA-binding protein, contains XRE-type HTH domain [Aquisalimonas asiatica]
MAERQRFNSVWDALEDSAEQAENMKLRAELMTQIRDYVEGLSMTQQAAAKTLGLTQPRLNDLLRGRLDKFSLDMLVNVLARAGKHVNVTISDQEVA